MKAFISYEGLPIKSGGAHTLTNKNQKENYNKTLEFLNDFTQIKAEEIELTIYESAHKNYSVLKYLIKLIFSFGFPKMRNDGFLKSWSWNLSQKNIEKGFEFLQLNQQLPNNPFGPISLNIKWNFYFKNSTTKEVLPNQNLIPQIDFRIRNSQIYLRMAEKSTMSVWFAFPFEKITEYEKEYFKKLKLNLPFNFSNNHWKLWKVSTKGNWTSQKIEF
ncbi:hypothetical protein [Chryseobacterium balustinum]|uniref:Uncharacterized protein n=1 Tax=Chryseobacterium balustinum TaxID=246 RepID=A0AAX2IIQ0_9FLAO|nr:hypothetical protein [Chryseobacterium balustinum]AZB31627.1 hypothetical protein EB354_21485 [Chryseobacterium balustinum]SKB81230.1 hypothetical protein SAMN05421800_109106 [Chryseobacterium balustinum]SQA88384.1 Uncharacterised protein [Chryseobacterium balustinum]